MKAKAWFAILLLAGAVPTSHAEPLLPGRGMTCSTCTPAFTCPDDYSPKPLPCVRPTHGCLPDDYCAKTMPRVPCATKACGADDYSRKPFSFCVPPSFRPWYSCGPGAAACEGCGKKLSEHVITPKELHPIAQGWYSNPGLGK
jgi:hypothetical protein